MSIFASHRWALSELALGLRSDASRFSFAALLSALALSIPIFIASVVFSLSEPLSGLQTSLELTVFTTKSADLKPVENRIRTIPFVDGTEILPSEKAFADLNRNLGIPQSKALSNPLPDIIIATVASNVSSEELAAAADEFRKIKNVDLVAYDDSWQRYLNALYTALSVVLGILGTVVFLLVLLVIFASVRLTTNAQRDEIRALHLFGATSSFIRRPYSWRGFLTLMLAAVLSLGVTATGVSLLAKPIADFAGLYGVTVILRMPAIDWCLLYVASAALLGYVVGSFAAKDAITRVLRHQP